MKITLLTTVMHDTDNLIIRDVPVSSVVLELDDGRLAIIDTGMADNPDLAVQLDEYGYAAPDFSLLLNTHLHPDHIGGNRLFSNARILISRREWDYERRLSRRLQEGEDPVSILENAGRNADPFIRQLAWDLKQLARDYPPESLIGDQAQLEYYEDEPQLPKAISLLPVPGHSIDSQAVILQGKTRRATAAGDALYHRDLWRTDPVAGLHYNHRQFRRSAEIIADFPDIIIPGHDRAFDNLTRQYLEKDSWKI